jgi:acetyl esterase/lipase
MGRTPFLRICTLALLMVPALVVAQQPQPRTVPSRQLPVPDTVSPALQKAIASPIAPAQEVPATAEAWKELQRTEDARAEKIAVSAAMLLGAQIEPVQLNEVPCFRVTPRTVAPGKDKFLLFHVHGGAFVFGGGRGATAEALLLADVLQMPTISVDYRRPPDHPHPAPVDDVLSVWKAVVKDRDPKTVVMGGTSAGGTLIMSALLRAKQEQLPMPAAAFLGTPGADLSKTGDSVFLNEEVDRILGRYDGFLAATLKLYAGPKDLKDPSISPVYADLSGFPPAVLLTGTRDMLLSATARTHRKLRAGGVTSELHVYEGMSHADYLLAFGSPESRDALTEIARFFDRYLVR